MHLSIIALICSAGAAIATETVNLLLPGYQGHNLQANVLEEARHPLNFWALRKLKNHTVQRSHQISDYLSRNSGCL
jgi:hypothetical protein